MTIIRAEEVTKLKMSTNPPKCVVDAEYCIISNDKVYQWVGIGWVELRTASEIDKENIPIIPTPHCSQCVFYELLSNCQMYCKNLKRRITARKQPCKKYKQI